MNIKHLRRSSMRSAMILAASGLMVSAPVQAVQAVQVDEAPEAFQLVTDGLQPVTDGLQELNEMVADLVDPAEVEETYRHVADGEASYYGRELAGNRTASGERFNPHAFTAAHRTLPMGTKLRVTNKANGRSVVVRINDRGPFVRGRIIDISLAAARQIQMVRSGKAMVRLEQIV